MGSRRNTTLAVCTCFALASGLLLQTLPATAAPDAPRSAAATTPSVSPTPQSISRTGDDVRVTGKVYVVADDATDAAARDRLVRELKNHGARQVKVVAPGNVPGDAARHLTVRLGAADRGDIARALGDTEAPGQAEGYALRVERTRNAGTVALGGRDADGQYYAVQTLRQLFLRAGGRGKISGVQVGDHPSMPLRGTIEGFYGQPWTHRERLDDAASYARFAHPCHQVARSPEVGPGRRTGIDPGSGAEPPQGRDGRRVRHRNHEVDHLREETGLGPWAAGPGCPRRHPGGVVVAPARPGGEVGGVLRIHHGQARRTALASQMASDRRGGRPCSGTGDDPLRNRVPLPGQLGEDLVGDGRLTAHGHRPSRVGEMVQEVAAEPLRQRPRLLLHREREQPQRRGCHFRAARPYPPERLGGPLIGVLLGHDRDPTGARPDGTRGRPHRRTVSLLPVFVDPPGIGASPVTWAHA